MMAAVHFLRPLCFLLLVPLLAVCGYFWKKSATLSAWSQWCDAHLFPYLLKEGNKKHRLMVLLWFFCTGLTLIISIAGPAWKQLPVPIYKATYPRVVLLDMSSSMMEQDLNPNRLSRAKLKLYDVLSQKGRGQFALIAYTQEPFVVSPLTDDGQTISALLPKLTPEIMPVDGNDLNRALDQAQELIEKAGHQRGQILIMTAQSPSLQAIQKAKQLAQKHIHSSMLVLQASSRINPLYAQLASAGKGLLLPYSSDEHDVNQWLQQGNKGQILTPDEQNEVILWQDEGRWFLMATLLLLLPTLRRGWFGI